MPEIPDKSYFKIGEVSRIVGVEPYNIRYWESQFREIRPSKTKSNQRLYRRKEIEVLLKIKDLLYLDGYTIAGAKKRIKSVMAAEAEGTSPDTPVDSGLSDEERKAYDARLADAQNEMDDLHAKVKTLTDELGAARENFAAQIDDQASSSLLAQKLETAELEVSRLAQEAHTAQQESERLSAELEAARKESERARAELDTANALLDAVAAKRGALAEKLRAELEPLLVLSRS